MTALVLADLHLSDNPRDDYRHRFMRGLPAIAQELLPDRIIILGDLTEEKDRHSAWLTNRVVDYVTALAEVCKVIVQMGNHDYISVEDPFFQFLGKLQGVTFIARPTAVDINGLGLCMFLPHTRNYKDEWDMKSWPKHLDWIFAHQTFQGADVGFGHRMDGIPLGIFGPKDRVISGDVHVPQTLKQVTYVGAPYTIDFGDDYKPRMLLVDKKGFKVIPCRGPQKRLVEINSLADIGKRDLMRGDILKVRVHILQEEVAEWPEMQRRIKAWAYDGGYQLFSCVPVLEQGKGRKRVRVTKEEAKTDQQIVQEFGTHRDVDERTLKTGLWLMDKSK